MRCTHQRARYPAQTAEMPGFYAAGEYDVAGFTVGAVHRDLDNVKQRSGVSPTDVHGVLRRRRRCRASTLRASMTWRASRSAPCTATLMT